MKPDYRPAYHTLFNGEPKRFIVKDTIDACRFLVAQQTGVLLPRSMVTAR